MNVVHFEPAGGYLCILKAKIPNFVPLKYRNIVFGNLLSSYYGGGLVRGEDGWAVYINQYTSLPAYELDRIVESINSEITAKGFGGKMNLEGKFIFRKLSEEFNAFLDSLVKVPGVIMYSFALLGESNTVFAFKFSKMNSEKVTQLITGTIADSKSSLEIQYLSEDKIGNVLGFFRFVSQMNPNFSKLILVASKWTANQDDLKNQNEGIFQNEMFFKPKFFGEGDSPVYGQLISDIKSTDIKGTANYAVVGESNREVIVEFYVKSKWFSDFYSSVIRTVNGAFFYWGYSDGAGNVENYYVIYENVLTEFLLGLKKLWEAGPRANHINYLCMVANISDAVDFSLSAKSSNQSD